MPKRANHAEPAAGKTFQHKFKGHEYKMVVVSAGNRIGYKVGREIFKTPTAAAISITKTATNGWRFWGII